MATDKKPGSKPAKKSKRANRPGNVPVVKAGGKRQIPWMTVGAVIVVLALIGGLAGYLVPKYNDQQNEKEATAKRNKELAQWVPSPTNPDPSDKIDGVVKLYYPAGQHVTEAQRVAYDQSPPFGGPHDQVWATCTGIAYPNALRTENAVHALEHGSIWITYNPKTVAAGDVDKLKAIVTGPLYEQQYIFMSPYPDQSTPVSLQSWGHQLKLQSASDPRIDQFIKSLRRNSQVNVYKDKPTESAYPEVGAECSAIPGSFDPASPPPADSGPLPPNAVPMSGEGTTKATDEMPQPTTPAPAP